MSGENDLSKLLKNMSPVLHDEEYVFMTKSGSYGDFSELKPIGSFLEKEGLTLIIPKNSADLHNVSYDTVFKFITLQVHSSLNAVGLTAAVSTKLTQSGISANVVAAYFHDHIFVQSEYAERACEALIELTD